MEKFINEFVEKLQNHFTDKKIESREICKNNNVTLHGILVIDENNDLTPTIYAENYYKTYVKYGIDVAVNDFIETYETEIQSTPFNFNLNDFKDFDKVKSYIKFKLINKEKNKEFLETVPHIDVLDLSAIYIFHKDGGTIVIHKEIMEKYWNTTEKELRKIATKNIENDYSIQSMMETVRELGAPEELMKELEQAEDTMPMYVLTNSSRIFGAQAILSKKILRECAEKIGSDYYLIPSSIHECIIVPVNNDLSLEYQKELVAEVNSTQVADTEVLSNSIYMYDISTNKLRIA